MILGLVQYSLHKDHQHHKLSSPDCLRRTSSGRSSCLYPSKNGGCSQIIENSKIGVSRHLDSSTTTQMAKIMVQYGRPSRSSWAKSVWSSFGRTIMGKATWENSIETWLGENSKLGMSLCSSWKRIILICVCGWHKIGWKETKSWTDVESTQQRSWLVRTNIFLRSCILGLHSKTMCHVRIANFSGENRKITIPSKSSYFFMVLWYGWSCKEVCGTILWVGEQNDSTTPQSIYSLHGWPDILWSVNKLARSITKWTKACDKRLNRLISYIHHTCEYKQYCHVGKHCQTMQIGTVSRLRFCRRSWGLKIYIRWNIVHFWKSYVCSNQLDV